MMFKFTDAYMRHSASMSFNETRYACIISPSCRYNAVASAWWLLMAYCLLGTKASATIMRPVGVVLMMIPKLKQIFFFRKPRDVHQLYTDDYLLAYQHFTEMKEMTGAP